MSRKLRIGGATLNQTPLDWQGNTQNILTAISDAQNHNVDILCLPELCITGYGCEDWFLSDWVPEKAIRQLDVILRKTGGLTVTVGLPVRKNNKVYNSIAVVSNNEILGFYAKHNLANEGVHYEPRWFNSWPYESIETIEYEGREIPFGAIDLKIEGIRVGFEICEDAWQEDRPARNLVKKGIELILNPSASHFAFNKEKIREGIVVSSSEKFNCTYLYTNLLGNEAGRMTYDGDILIARNGKLIGHNRRFSFKSINTLYLDVDFDSDASEINIKEDFRTSLEEFAHAVPLALFDYCRKSKSKGFVLSLSGGADSSTIAVLVAQMVRLGVKELGHSTFIERLGLQRDSETEKEIVGHILTTAYQRTQNSSKETTESARYLAESLGATHYEWKIDDQVDGYTKTIETAIGHALTWENHDITLQNIQARARSPVIWMLANLNNALLLTTSNRSEGDVGYATMDGDTSGSISPIAAVDKEFVLEWIRYAEVELGFEGLSKVNQLQPTAELRPSDQKQTDEKDLMPYKALASIERLAIKEKQSPKAVFEALKSEFDPSDLKEWIRKFFRLWARNQWKRERIAPSFHVDDFNVDPRTWCRFPILSSGFADELGEL